MSRDDVIRLVQEYVERADEHACDSLLRDPPDNEDQKADLQTLRDRDDPNTAASIYPTGTNLQASLSRSDASRSAEFLRCQGGSCPAWVGLVVAASA